MRRDARASAAAAVLERHAGVNSQADLVANLLRQQSRAPGDELVGDLHAAGVQRAESPPPPPFCSPEET